MLAGALREVLDFRTHPIVPQETERKVAGRGDPAGPDGGRLDSADDWVKASVRQGPVAPFHLVLAVAPGAMPDCAVRKAS